MNTISISEISKCFPKKQSNFILECYDYLRDIVPFDGHKIFVSGGFFPRRFIGSTLRDIDVYVNGDEAYLVEVIEDYRRLDWAVIEVFEKTYDKEENKRNLHFICSKDGEPNIDLIAFHQPKAVSHIKSFDLDIVQLAITDDEFHLVDMNIFQQLENKLMTFTGNICTRTLERIIKYTTLGYRMDADELIVVRNAFVEKITNDVRVDEHAATLAEEIGFRDKILF